MINVPKYDDLLKIEEFLRENELDNGNLSVVLYIQTQERLNRINKDYYYKANPQGECPLDQDIDKVNITNDWSNGVKIEFVTDSEELKSYKYSDR